MRRKIFIKFLCGLAVLVLVNFGTPVKAEIQDGGTANNLGIYGGNTWDIAIDGDYVYTTASGTPNGFFYSTDAGETWQQPVGNNDFGAGQSVEVDHATGDVYVGLGGDLYKSTDHGATLTLIEEDAGNPVLFGQDTVLAVWNGTVKVSTDHGATFTSAEVDTNVSVRSLATSATSGTFYAVAENTDSVFTLYISTDSGSTWSPMTVLVDEEELTSFSTVRTNPYNADDLTIADDHHLYLSHDAGVTFVEVTNAPASCNTIATWTVTGRLYACSSFSDDNGATWTEMDFDDIVRGPGKTIEVNTENEDILYGDSMSGVTKSVDGGITWVNSYNGILGVNVLAISTTVDKSVAWTSSSNGLAKSTDFNSGNPTWEFPILPCAEERCDPSGIGESVWVKPDDANIVLAGSIGGFIFRSTDAGQTWELADVSSVNDAKFIDSDSGMSFLRPYKFVSDPNDTSIIYVALSGDEIGMVAKSTDSGATWEDLTITDDAPARTLDISALGVLYVGTGFSSSTLKGIYAYTDSNWTLLTGMPTDVDVSSVVIDPDNESIIYATTTGDAVLGADGFYKSTDNGETWEQAEGLTDYYNFSAITVQSSTTPNTLYISCRDNDWHGILLKSSDGGATWGVLYTGLKSETFNSLVFDGLLASSDLGLYKIRTNSALSFKINKKIKTIKVNKGDQITFRSHLTDASTGKNLKNKKIKIYRKYKNGHWKSFRSMKTNTKGIITGKIKVQKLTSFKVSWTPNTQQAEEYVSSLSRVIKVRIK
ncbi:MAG: hypothetical protein A2458_01510 [Candidatus Kerfeldbacteria bacterium RIFOXYC2_FULL_38_9]|uniref:Sortilin N-terminal domain-containing protein n=1 Tax=Candidatus Kerfeldbacteria bacterium RIFOXYB2_FULL_38_14 TaxID=1798547 RepID=A0A1G2BGW4_9BACT|nr:MAG: hypothetical protein A2319_03920 [Candidatus Kerfeldbacteria bacterium RIFOXYB2_FULL_38_14]OGY89722.1 MAG: hypothetical protein A2458_01510 [Candidatus Kerfeldbacteria bacterium RIFOXYC2_FULL_38_9]